MKVWVTSDFHFGHNKDFIWKARGYNSLAEMEKDLVEKYNSVVSDEDEVYMLGDFAIGERAAEGISEYLPQLKGKKYFIMGNHDTSPRIERYRQEFGINVEGAMRITYKKYTFLATHYPSITSNFDYDRPLKQRVINLCGHAHTTDKFELMKQGILSYHVEVDAHDGYPVELSQVIQDIKDFLDSSL